MGFNDILKKLFGNKSDRDLRLIQPWVEKIKAAYPEIEQLSNDELRARTQSIMQMLQDAVAKEKNRIQELRDTVETLEVEKREKVWNEIDTLKKRILDIYEEKLLEVLPEVYSIVKNTAYRFANNEVVEVTATPMDRDLAATKDFVTIEGDKALYKSTWMAGGNPLKWDMVHYDVQLFGGVVLHQGKIAEMATGEGKTLVSTLPVFLNALTHNGVHVVTVNSYLSKRDSEWMGPLYQFHGLTVDCIDKHQPNSEERRQAYLADITFGTNNEFGFDYLRDNMATNPSDLVQREHNFAIVDEVDSVLIDDARTPLIISGPVAQSSEYSDEQLFNEFLPRVEVVVREQKSLFNKLLNEAKQKLSSTEKSVKDEGATQLYRAYLAWPKNTALIKFLSEPGMKQEMLRAEAYFLQDNRKEWPVAVEPLYFVIEEKQNSVDLTDKGLELLTGNLDDPTFFVLPDVGTEIAEIEHSNLSSEEKLAKKDAVNQNYALKSVRVHVVQQLLKAYTMFEKEIDYIIQDGKVMIVDKSTGRVMDGRRWSDGLHEAVEAKEHVKIGSATQTFATITLQNYFRMYHKLSGMTGTAETEAGEFWDIYKLDVVTIPTNRPVLRIDMNDRIYKTKRAKYAAVIEEVVRLIGEGRPVLVGTTSVEDSELLSRMLKLRNIKHNVLNAKLHQREADIVAEAGKNSTVTIATNMAGRGTDIKLSQEVKDAGGLAIIGTERHESRRVDRQLRGRSGRQGDPGSSVFFVSLEDELMRIFGSDRLSKTLDRLGFKEEDVIEHSMISKNIEKAQKKVEENNFGQRKRLLEYDDVMNAQRDVVYRRRRNALMGERLGIDFMNMTYDLTDQLVREGLDTGEYESLQMSVFRNFAIELPIQESEMRSLKHEEIVNRIFDAAMKNFNRRSDKLVETVGPRMKEIYEQVREAGIIKNIVVPFSDGQRIYQIPCNLEEAVQTNGKSVIKSFMKNVMLHVIDDAWKANLRDLDDLKQAAQNAHYEQKDPLLIYKLESYKIFEEMVQKMNSKAVSILMRCQLYIPENQPVKEAAPERRPDMSRMQTNHASAPGMDGKSEKQKPQPIVAKPHIGRNDPCPCGSGLKYKNCHGKNI